jgi:hypothetical protein
LGKAIKIFLNSYVIQDGKMKYLLVVLCFALCECVTYYECEYESSSYPYWTEWTDGELISIINDSLAVVASYRYKKECLDQSEEGSFEWRYWDETTRYRTGLFLVNYRTKKKPLRGDTLKSEYKMLNYGERPGLNILNGYLFKDSSALVFDLANSKFGFWKIGGKTIKLTDHNKVYDLKYASGAGHWVNGSIIFSSFYYMNVLNMEKGQIEQFKYSRYSTQEEWMPGYEWMQKYQCRYSFLSYIGDKAVCIDGSLLLIDGIPVDTIKFSGDVSGLDVMFGNYVSAKGRILKIDTLNLKFDKDFSLWIDRNPLRFYNDINNPDDFVSYSGQDLINFGR